MARRLVFLIVLLTVPLLCGARPARAAGPGYPRAIGGIAPRALRAPLALLAGSLAGRPHDDFTALESGRGRRVLQLEVEETAVALLLEVRGSVEFERIDFALGDGGVTSIDAFGAVRGPGLYEVARLGSGRHVRWVRIVARARSRDAGLGLRLGV